MGGNVKSPSDARWTRWSRVRWNSPVSVCLCSLLSSCGVFGAVPLAQLDDPEAIEVRILATSTRIFSPGNPGRFTLAITNRSSNKVAFDVVDVVLSASPSNHPTLKSLAGKWKLPMGQRMVLAPGKQFTFPLKPEPIEFQMGSLLPGPYSIRASVFDRYTSKPYVVRVDRPDIPLGARR